MVEKGLPEGLFDSASAGSFHAVTAWLNEGGGVDARCAEHYDDTLLIAAACGGHEAMVRMLLQRGASVNLLAFDGGAALMGAASRGHTTIVQALLDAKADASLQDSTSGSTALGHRRRRGRPRRLRWRLRRRRRTRRRSRPRLRPRQPSARRWSARQRRSGHWRRGSRRVWRPMRLRSSAVRPSKLPHRRLLLPHHLPPP